MLLAIIGQNVWFSIGVMFIVLSIFSSFPILGKVVGVIVGILVIYFSTRNESLTIVLGEEQKEKEEKK